MEKNICTLQEMLGYYLESLTIHPDLHSVNVDLREDFQGWYIGWRESAENFDQEDTFDPKEAEEILVAAVAILKQAQ